MIHTEKLCRKPRFFRMFTGLTAEEFEKLLGELEPVWKSILATKSKRTPRRRKPGGGRKVKVPLADRLLVTLLYYRTYVTQEFVGYLFGVDKGTVSRIVEAVGKALTGVFRIPEKKVRVDPEVMKEVFLDATERSVYRPQRKQRRSYSGKKKRHTVKHRFANRGFTNISFG